MTKKRKIPYRKIVDGFAHCFGAFGRNCEDCPYDTYNEEDPYGDAPAWCHEKLEKDIKRWGDQLAGFCHCEDCSCYHPNLDEHETYRSVEDPEDGFCSLWRCMMGADDAEDDRKRGGVKMRNEPMLYMLDEKGQPREVKVIRDQPVFAVDPSVTLPKFSAGVDFSVDVDPGAFKKLEKILEEHDREILKAYDMFAKALECCLQDIRRCRECPLKDDDSCRGRLLHNAMRALLNHKDLHRQMMTVRSIKERD